MNFRSGVLFSLVALPLASASAFAEPVLLARNVVAGNDQVPTVTNGVLTYTRSNIIEDYTLDHAASLSRDDNVASMTASADGPVLKATLISKISPDVPVLLPIQFASYTGGSSVTALFADRVSFDVPDDGQFHNIVMKFNFRGSASNDPAMLVIGSMGLFGDTGSFSGANRFLVDGTLTPLTTRCNTTGIASSQSGVCNVDIFNTKDAETLSSTIPAIPGLQIIDQSALDQSDSFVVGVKAGELYIVDYLLGLQTQRKDSTVGDLIADFSHTAIVGGFSGDDLTGVTSDGFGPLSFRNGGYNYADALAALDTAQINEPEMALFGFGLVGLAALRRRS